MTGRRACDAALIGVIVVLGLLVPLAIVLWRCWRCVVEALLPRAW